MKYTTSITDAIAERRNHQTPRVAVCAGAVAVYVIAYLALALLCAPHGKPHANFREGKAVDSMSSVFLGMTCALALANFLLRRDSPDWGKWFWLLMSVAFLFLALDELLEFHEKFGRYIRKSPIGPTKSFRNWNDVIVILYGVAALAGGLSFLPEILRFPRFLTFLIVGGVFYCVHTSIDSLWSGHGHTVPEESMKLFAVASFMVAALVAHQTIARPNRAPPTVP